MKIINGIRMYDTTEMATLFNVTTTTVCSLRKKGLLRSVRLGRAYYTSEQTIRDYLNGLIIPLRDKK